MAGGLQTFVRFALQGLVVVDKTPEPRDVSLTVEEDCGNVLESLLEPYPEFASLLKDVIPDVTPENITDVFIDPAAEVTVLVPPRESAAGLLHAYENGDLTKQEVCFFLYSLCMSLSHTETLHSLCMASFHLPDGFLRCRATSHHIKTLWADISSQNGTVVSRQIVDAILSADADT
jgi:hypothetical protein